MQKVTQSLPAPVLGALVAAHVHARCLFGNCASASAKAPPQPISTGNLYFSATYFAQGVLRVLRARECRRLDRVQMRLPPASPLEELSLAGAGAGPAHVQGLGLVQCVHMPCP